MAGWICMLCCLWMVSTVWAKPPGPRTAAQSYSEAEEALARGDYLTAVALLKEAYALKPNPNFTYNIGFVYRKMGHYDQAAEHFRRVQSNRKASRKLRRKAGKSAQAMDAKLGQAWLRVEGDARNGDIFVDGQPWRPSSIDSEYGVPPGNHIIEIRHPEYMQVFLEFRQMPVNRRTTLNVDLSQLRSVDGQLSLIGYRQSLTVLAINGYRLQSDLSAVQAVCLPAGSYRVRVSRTGKEPVERPVMLGTGMRLSMKQLLNSSPSEGVRMPYIPESIRTVRSQSDSTVSAWPYVTAATGLVFAGVGTWMMLDAQGIREDAEAELEIVNVRGEVEGIRRVDAVKARDDANTRALWGTISTVAGTSLVVGGVVWWFLEYVGDSPSDAAVNVSLGPTAVFVEGRF